MAIHWKDVEGKELTPYPAGQKVGYDIALELIDRYQQKTMLVEAALHIGAYIGAKAGQEPKTDTEAKQ